LIFSQFLFLLSCQTKLSLSEELALIEEARLNPSDGLKICSQISSQKIKEECISITAHHLKGEPNGKEQLCKELSGSLQAECFFELAEEVQDSKYCLLAGDFLMDCRLHILESQCGKYQTLSALISLTENLDLVPKHPNVGNILYGCLFSNSQPKDICSQTPDPKQCANIQKRQIGSHR
tara:strand:+ start:98 stop:634 length:537 start_codon:yes stop_codon:yes gene_type:complete